MIELVTEKEAESLWCPFARSYTNAGDDDDTPVTINRTRRGAPNNWCLCIASNCMAWRWEKDVGSRTEARGFCGLAGAP